MSSKDSYFVITTSADGIRIEQLDHGTLIAQIEEDYWGMGANVDHELPTKSDPNYWGDSMVIIKGRVVVPRPVETVTKYEVD